MIPTKLIQFINQKFTETYTYHSFKQLKLTKPIIRVFINRHSQAPVAD